MPLPDPKKVVTNKFSMWMITMPGLTGDILERTGKKIPGVLWHSQMVNLGPPEWAEWQEACRVELGLPIDWQMQQYDETVARFRELGWGKLFGPGSPGGYKKKTPKEEVVHVTEELDLHGTLFEY